MSKGAMDRRLVLAAAWLSTQGLTQDEISRHLRGGQSTVSRQLRAADSQGWRRSRMRWPPDLSAEDRDWIVSHSFAKHDLLFRELNRRALSQASLELSTLHVVPGPFTSGSREEERRAAIAAFAVGAAAELNEYLMQARTCAVAWGRTISAVLAEVTEIPKPDKAPSLVLALAGEPTNHRLGAGSSDACRQLAKTLGVDHLALDGVPARIWKHQLTDPNAEPYIRSFVGESRAYTNIFGTDKETGSEPPLIDKVDLILTGVGDVTTSMRSADSTPADPWFVETSEAEDLTAEDLDRIAVGNIGGVWLPKSGANQEERERVDGINERWLGIKREHFLKCNERARIDGVPGVVCVAVEPEKVNVVLESMGLVSRLVISAALANALLEKLGVA